MLTPEDINVWASVTKAHWPRVEGFAYWTRYFRNSAAFLDYLLQARNRSRDMQYIPRDASGVRLIPKWKRNGITMVEDHVPMSVVSPVALWLGTHLREEDHPL